MKILIYFGTLIALVIVNSAQQEQRINILVIGESQKCEGKQSAKYTFIAQYTTDSACSLGSVEPAATEYMISCSPNGQKEVNSLKLLSSSIYPAGAYIQFEGLYLVQSGNLQGKYVYVKEIALAGAYLKKCSSVLGYSYISAQSRVVLIADKLDLNIFLSPGGAFERFKKSASTICQTSANFV